MLPKQAVDRDMAMPFMEHPDGAFDSAVEAMSDAIRRLRELPSWSDWITFSGQGYGGRPDTYHFAEIKVRGGELRFNKEGLPEEVLSFDFAGAPPAIAAAFLDEVFRKHMGIEPFPGEGPDYAVGAEW